MSEQTRTYSQMIAEQYDEALRRIQSLEAELGHKQFALDNCKATLVESSTELLAANAKVAALTEVLRKAQEALVKIAGAKDWQLDAPYVAPGIAQRALNGISKALGE